MPDPEELRSGGEVERLAGEVGRADLLVGVPSYNHAGTIEAVIRGVQAGLAEAFPQARGLIVVADGGSTDGTQDVVGRLAGSDPRPVLLASPVLSAHRTGLPYHGVAGKERAVRGVLELARALEVKACCLLEAELPGLPPGWIEALLRPIWEGEADYIVPRYARHKFDGTITTQIVYPLTRALYGKRLRHPMGGQCGLSGKLAAHYLDPGAWRTDPGGHAVDLWLTTHAVVEGHRVWEAFLGARPSPPRGPGVDLPATISQVVGALFALMERYEEAWPEVRGSAPVPLAGARSEGGPAPIQVNLARMVSGFRQGLRDLLPLWEQVLAPETLADLYPLGDLAAEEFRFTPDLWVRVVYDFALAYRFRILHRDHLLRCLTPLYLGRTASFVRESWTATAEEAEEGVERLCREFERGKPYLVDRWR